jgi:hypothetical protein
LKGRRAGIDDQAKRLYVSRWLTQRAIAAVGGAVPDDAPLENLDDLAVRIRQYDPKRMPLTGLRFEPPYPGRALESTTTAGRARLLLACTVRDGAATLGVVFTVLIAGRHPEVSVAPSSASAQVAIDDG